MAKGDKLQPKQLLFCEFYAGLADRAYMANATLSYIHAYGIDTPTTRIFKKWKKGEKAYWDNTKEYKYAKSEGHRLLQNPTIKETIHKMFRQRFNEDHVDNELLKVIDQDEDRMSKVAGIREFNALKGRITKKIKLSGSVKSNMAPDRLAQVAEVVLKKSKQKK